MSFGIILVITVERCIVMCLPFKKNLHSKEIRRAVFIVLLVSVVYEIPYIMNIHIYEAATVSYKCEKNISASNTGYYAPLYQEDQTKDSNICPSQDTYPNVSISHSFVIYRLCNSAQENVTINGTYPAGKSNLTNHQFYCDLTNCTISWHTCIPSSNDFYNYTRVVMFFLRDIIFIIIFVASITFMYRSLKSHETVFRSQSSIRPRKTLFMLVTMATTFLLLVLPRDFFHLIHTLSILTNSFLGANDSFKVNLSLIHI